MRCLARDISLQVIAQHAGSRLQNLVEAFQQNNTSPLRLCPCKTPVRRTRDAFWAVAGHVGIEVSYIDFDQPVRISGQLPASEYLAVFTQRTLIKFNNRVRDVEAFDVVFPDARQVLEGLLPLPSAHYLVHVHELAEETPGDLQALFDAARRRPTRRLRRILSQLICEQMQTIKFAQGIHDIRQKMGRLRARLINALSLHASGSPIPPPSTQRIDPRLQRVADFIEQQQRWEYEPEQLCELAGMSLRALYYGFERTFGTTPYRFHRNCKLARVRLALLCDVPQQNPVAWHATNEGFFHLGRFATQYRNLFGELPSATTARAQRTAVAPPIDCTDLMHAADGCNADACDLWYACDARE